MNIEEIIINLKVLEKVQIHEKLISRGQYLNIEYVSVVPLGIRRWWRQDNRNEMLKKINLTIKCAIEILASMHQQCRIIEHSNKKTLDVKPYLINAKKGLENLKETYVNCTTTCAQLDICIDSIDVAIR
jgi:hypothetical protein